MARSSPHVQFLFALSLAAVGATIAVPQTTPSPNPRLAFEVASIRINKTANGRWRMNFTPDGLSAMGVSLQYIVHDAYGIYDNRLWSGGPSWIDSQKFDIEAKFDPAEFKNLDLAQRRAMLQQLLADRFKLSVHHETREFPLYTLIVAKNGAKLRESKPENLHYSGLDAKPVCHVVGSKLGFVAFQGCSVSALLSRLSSDPDVDRTVVDHTGLTGYYDFELHWTPENAPPTFESEGPAIFAALEQQLGLKLESTRGPLDVIVIDHAEMPSEN
jgi:uncharacterized protein (TIGR03435 family)